MSKQSVLAAPSRRPEQSPITAHRAPRAWAVRLRAMVVAAVLGSIPIGAWVYSEQRPEMLFMVILLAAFVAWPGYLGARSIFRTPQ